MRDVPRLLLVTDRTQLADPTNLLDVIAAAVAAGAHDVLLRERDLTPAAYAPLADQVDAILRSVGGRLVVRDMAHATGRRGVHLRSSDPQPRRRPALLGRSVHDTGQLAAARVAGSDYVTLSPVALSTSKPDYGPPLGPAGISRTRAAVPGAPPVLALGGVETPLVPQLLAAGAYGIAVMGAVMRAPDPALVVEQLLDALQSSPPNRSIMSDLKEPRA
ncbi:thiamine phosphate synthase [Luteipulveratus mongoliensis]|uniref:Thiamine phosphate synthase/TenI domain-containing protein n=1 Tax=Luteipulveratus mongoliensis TaxID=571913 RepID=A0A0K1JJW9_9MICO|nr:thiamine phosphate synthase [Luteipulveratus mongoliensis]AKU17012.1 hypothetical protein VV02_16000 [Luteipulveratus mongoliensis]